ncbi:MAG: signal peptidase I [Lachnospiraceae bacterium]|nr:signal peptidase I [Lachnospiraceae bacterium]
MSYFHPIPDENKWTDVAGKWITDCIFVIALAFWLVYMFGQQVVVVGNSMSPTLSDENTVLVNRMVYTLSEPERYDVVYIETEEEDGSVTTMIKRIIGLPGETVQITDGRIYIDGELLDFQPDAESILNAGIADTPILLGRTEYFVIGDNWNNSQDSRVEEVGNIAAGEIIGKVWLRTSPFKNIGLVE